MKYRIIELRRKRDEDDEERIYVCNVGLKREIWKNKFVHIFEYIEYKNGSGKKKVGLTKMVEEEAKEGS